MLTKGKIYFYQDDPKWFWLFQYDCTIGGGVFDTGHVEVEGGKAVFDTCLAENGYPLIYTRHIEEYECREATDSEIKLLEEACP